jgi:xanthine/uracil permease
MQLGQEYPTRSLDRIYYPEDRLPLVKLIPMGIQHVIAMFGGTVLAPLLMGLSLSRKQTVDSETTAGQFSP